MYNIAGIAALQRNEIFANYWITKALRSANKPCASLSPGGITKTDRYKSQEKIVGNFKRFFL